SSCVTILEQALADDTTLLAQMLFVVEPETYKVLKRFKIADEHLGLKAIHGVNELEWVNGELWGNVYPMYQVLLKRHTTITHHSSSSGCSCARSCDDEDACCAFRGEHLSA
ncbi:MAG: hypothetical protein SGPRY_011708, partial [Prymnesium sp.]